MNTMLNLNESSSVLRNSHSLSIERFSLWQGYSETLGLDKFRSDERYSAWMHTHRRLCQGDPKYASDCRWFKIRVVICLLAALGIGLQLSSLVAGVTFALACSVVLGYGEQRRRNCHIGEKLLSA